MGSCPDTDIDPKPSGFDTFNTYQISKPLMSYFMTFEIKKPESNYLFLQFIN